MVYFHFAQLNFYVIMVFIKKNKLEFVFTALDAMPVL